MAADDFVRIVRLVDENGNYIATLPVSLAAGEISIGAIELKDGITDDRAEVTPDLRLSTNANQQVGDADVNNANPVPVDATGQGDVPVTLDSEQVDVSDRVARDLGKVNVADVDGFDSVKGQKAMTESFPVVLPSDQASVPVDATVVTSGGAGATIGVTTGAKVVTDGVGTVQQYLRGLVTLVAAKIGITVADGDNAALGTTTGAAVVTDAAGSVQQYLRGIVKLLISIISVKIDQTTPGTTNKVVAETEPIAAAAADIHAPAVNTAAVVTYAGVGAVRHCITGMAWSYDGGIPVGGNILVEDVAATDVFNIDITEEGPGFFIFPSPKRAAAVNTAMIITLAAGGAGVTGKLSVLNHWTE